MSVLAHKGIIDEPRKVLTREVLLSRERLGEPSEVLLSSLNVGGCAGEHVRIAERGRKGRDVLRSAATWDFHPFLAL